MSRSSCLSKQHIQANVKYFTGIAKAPPSPDSLRLRSTRVARDNKEQAFFFLINTGEGVPWGSLSAASCGESLITTGETTVMKNILAPVILLLCAGTLAAVGPAIQFEKLEHDFGTVRQKTVVRETFAFTNTGDATLVIEKLETSCFCLKTVLSRKEIPAGESGSIEVAFHTLTFKDAVIKSVYVYTNDRNNEIVKIKLTANVME